MSATPRILIAGYSAIAAVCACLLRRAGHDVTLLGNEWQSRQAIAVRGLWDECQADDFHHAGTAAELRGTYELIVLTEPGEASTLRRFITNDGLALALSGDRQSLDAVAQVFGAEQTLGARFLCHAVAGAAGEVSVVGSDKPLAIGPLDVSDCVMMENIHRWIRAFQAAGIPCEATVDILAPA